MSLYLITLVGCDDSTRVPMELDEAQHAVIGLLADRATKAGGGCQPVMRVEAWDDLAEYEREEIGEVTP